MSVSELPEGEKFEPVGFGMWKDRSEMGKSSKWVAELREKEWSRWRQRQ